MDHSFSRLASLLAAFGILATAADAATLAAHRAIYDLQLIRGGGGNSGMSSVNGRLAYEITGSQCEGWTTNFRMVNRFVESDSGGRLVDTQSSAWESGDGVDLRYTQQEYINSKLEGEKRLKVTRAAPGGEGQGLIEKPSEKEFRVGAEALFPMQHQAKLMELANSGENRDSSVVYDGSDGEKAYQVITFIGKRIEPGKNADDTGNAETKPLAALPSWPMNISYYDHSAEGGSDTPSYQVSFDMYNNGVVTGLKLDYGSFALEGKLSKLEMLKSEPCQ
jgi:hypothetical protein